MRALARVTAVIGSDAWCLVGGMMVLVAARAAGGRLPRAEQTKDGDVLVDVHMDAKALGRVVAALEDFGFTPAPPFRNSDTRCTFTSAFGQIDVLCPDDATEEMLKARGATSLAIPGGRRALELSEPVTLIYDDPNHVDLQVPLLPSAILVKAAAVLFPPTAGQARHIQDVAGMLSVLGAHPQDPAATLSEADFALLAQLSERLTNPEDDAWNGMANADREDALAAYRLLLSREP